MPRKKYDVSYFLDHRDHDGDKQILVKFVGYREEESEWVNARTLIHDLGGNQFTELLLNMRDKIAAPRNAPCATSTAETPQAVSHPQQQEQLETGTDQEGTQVAYCKPQLHKIMTWELLDCVGAVHTQLTSANPFISQRNAHHLTMQELGKHSEFHSLLQGIGCPSLVISRNTLLQYHSDYMVAIRHNLCLTRPELRVFPFRRLTDQRAALMLEHLSNHDGTCSANRTCRHVAAFTRLNEHSRSHNPSHPLVEPQPQTGTASTIPSDPRIPATLVPQ